MLIEKAKRAVIAAVVGTVVTAAPAAAQKKYDAGASDSEIRIGNITPYSGPASAYAVIGKASEAYFRMINEHGGINGRKITFITYDDAYSPPKTVEQTRKLVESDEVLLVFQPLGTAGNTAIHKYLNTKKVPQLFVASGATKWGDPKQFPWTMGFQPNYQSEGRIYARYILEHYPNGKIGVLYQNDDFGKDMLKGLKDGLGAKGSMIVSEANYEITDPTADSQIVKLKTAGADIFVDFTAPRFAALAIKKLAELGWKPVHFLASVSGSIGSVLQPAGFQNAQGILSTAYTKDPSDPTWKNDAKMQAWSVFMDKYMPGANKADQGYVSSAMAAQTLVEVLRRCGDDLTRANVMRQAASLKNFEVDVLLPGITITTGPNDFFPVEQMQMRRFKGEAWELFGPILNGDAEGGPPRGRTSASALIRGRLFDHRSGDAGLDHVHERDALRIMRVKIRPSSSPPSVAGCGASNDPVQSIFFSGIKRAYVGPCAPDSSKCSERSCGAAR